MLGDCGCNLGAHRWLEGRRYAVALLKGQMYGNLTLT
jgi:hypothetical protein